MSCRAFGSSISIFIASMVKLKWPKKPYLLSKDMDFLNALLNFFIVLKRVMEKYEIEA